MHEASRSGGSRRTTVPADHPCERRRVVVSHGLASGVLDVARIAGPVARCPRCCHGADHTASRSVRIGVNSAVQQGQSWSHGRLGRASHEDEAKRGDRRSGTQSACSWSVAGSATVRDGCSSRRASGTWSCSPGASNPLQPRGPADRGAAEQSCARPSLIVAAAGETPSSRRGTAPARHDPGR